MKEEREMLVIVVLAVALFLFSSAPGDDHARKGALIGAGVGALAGRMVGSNTAGTLIGAAGGALAGTLVDHAVDRAEAGKKLLRGASGPAEERISPLRRPWIRPVGRSHRPVDRGEVDSSSPGMGPGEAGIKGRQTRSTKEVAH